METKTPTPKKAAQNYQSLAVGLAGLLSVVIGFLLAIALSTPVGFALRCANQAYSYGCGIPGFVLGIIIVLVGAPIFLGRYLHVKWPVLVVLFSTIALFVIYLLTGGFVGRFVTEDSLSWVILAYGIVNGLLFMLFHAVTEWINF